MSNRKLGDYFKAIIIAILIALFVRTFVIQAFKIPSGSMEPTLIPGDHILVNKFIWGIHIPFTSSFLKIIPFNFYRLKLIINFYANSKILRF